ncbi:hypothetical protein OC861_004962 [Tilletia horrida]|nr:hypothetical protein OC861_004962 [Tilletia horrida]
MNPVKDVAREIEDFVKTKLDGHEAEIQPETAKATGDISAATDQVEKQVAKLCDIFTERNATFRDKILNEVKYTIDEQFEIFHLGRGAENGVYGLTNTLKDRLRRTVNEEHRRFEEDFKKAHTTLVSDVATTNARLLKAFHDQTTADDITVLVSRIRAAHPIHKDAPLHGPSEPNEINGPAGCSTNIAAAGIEDEPDKAGGTEGETKDKGHKVAN